MSNAPFIFRDQPRAYIHSIEHFLRMRMKYMSARGDDDDDDDSFCSRIEYE